MHQVRIALFVLVALVAAADAGADLSATRVTVATTATLVCTAFPRGGSCLIRNAGANSMFLGDATVTTANGFELVSTAAVSLPLERAEKVYAVVAAATERADVIRSPGRLN